MNATELPFSEQGPLEQVRPRSHLIEIIAPDRYCTTVLLEHAAQLFPAEVVSDLDALDGIDPVDRSAWIVRLEPPPGRDWALELLSLVERSTHSLLQLSLLANRGTTLRLDEGHVRTPYRPAHAP